VPSHRELVGPSTAFHSGDALPDLGGIKQELAMIRRQLSSILDVQHELQSVLHQVGSDVSILVSPHAHGHSHDGKAKAIRPKAGLRHGPTMTHGVSGAVEQEGVEDELDDRESVEDAEENAKPNFGLFSLKQVHDRMNVRQSILVKDGEEAVTWSPEDEMRHNLKTMFEKAEMVMQQELKLKMAKRDRFRYWYDQTWQIWKSNERFSMALDVFVSITICLNVFSTIFLLEIVFKVYMNGFRGHFCTGTPWMNCFDSFIILVDFVQVWMELTMSSAMTEDTPSASLFRMIRLLRLTRILRVTKSDTFKELAELMHGIVAGMYTTVWSLLLFAIVMYVVALVFRETLGRAAETPSKEHVFQLFNNVPRAWFTTFRCSFGDCNSKMGVPIFEYVLEDNENGEVLGMFYGCFTILVEIVLFNVISAMFVESTMEAAAHISNLKRRERLQDEGLLYTRIAILVRRIMIKATGTDPGQALTEHLDTIVRAQVPRETIDQVIYDNEAKQALMDLDINPLDHGRLSDIFDPDNGGTIGVMDIAAGIRRLRGEARRSDIVCVDLMLRHVQSILVDMADAIGRIEMVVLPQQEPT